jgi:uncharacterized protein (UPF0332 family)/predicted nucleotidyltransferase
MAVFTEKREALDYFLAHLLGSEVKDYIAKIFLFGSVARGYATGDSDIDLLVFALGETEKVRVTCADASFEAVLEYGESIEPMVYSANEFRYPASDFVSIAIQRGKEVYSMKEEDISRKEAQNYLDLAKDYLGQAQNSISRNDLRLGVDGAYNACELAIKGLLLLSLGEIPKTRCGIVQKFGEIYVKEGPLPKETGREIRLGLDLRNRARYDSLARIMSADASKLAVLASFLINALDGELSKEN